MKTPPPKHRDIERKGTFGIKSRPFSTYEIDSQKALRQVFVNEPNKNFPNNKVTNTKYTALTFLPKNLAEQFSQNMNRYFLLIACLQLIREITPVNPASTWLPLITVLLLSAIKEGLDDLARHKRDKQINQREVTVLRDGAELKIPAMDIRVGELVKVLEDEQAPCDLCLIVSSTAGGSCYIQTSNLDGESDFKQRHALEGVQKMFQQPPTDISEPEFPPTEPQHPQITISASKLAQLKEGKLYCSHPNTEVYEFNARIMLGGIDLSLSAEQLVQQTAVLRYTEFIWGVAVYTGHETKLGMNKREPKMKWTSAEQFINKLSLIVFVFQLATVIVFGLIGSHRLWLASSVWYLGFNPEEWVWYQELVVPARFLLLCSMMIPISLKVTLDFVRAFYAKLIDWDELMYDSNTNRFATAANTAISEDLGQIDIILSDKTGTLTENIMVFKKCMIVDDTKGSSLHKADIFDNSDNSLTTLVNNSESTQCDFFRILALCHSVTAQLQGNGTYEYRSSSPDEEALVHAAASYGVRFVSREKNMITLEVKGQPEQHEILHTLQFSSDRKRMSVVVRHKEKLMLLSKGADDAILRLVKGQGDQGNLLVEDIKAGLEAFASKGLRTLCIASRSLTEDDEKEYREEFEHAIRNVQQRDQRVAKVYDLLEHNLQIVGVTAIEDKLQVGVPETIQALRDAGLKVWMLTGDKYSTALQVAKACNLHKHDQRLISLTEADDALLETLTSHKDTLNNTLSDPTAHIQTTLIITTDVLKVILPDHDLSTMFASLAVLAQAVVCCRVTPLQKAQVAALAKNTGFKTLAIGDGGNDVNMIQEAHVGVGIDGREGQQAARAADYAIGQFQFLRRLLFVHGHLSYHRTAFIAQYSFYKSLVICFIQLGYATQSSLSGASLFNSLSLMGYNVFYTGLLACFFVFDIDIAIHKLESDPKLYLALRPNVLLNWRTFAKWVVRALGQAIVVLCVTANCAGSNAIPLSSSGHILGDEEMSMVAFTSLIWIQILTILLESKTVTKYNALVLGGTLAMYYLLNMGFSLVPRLSMFGLMFHILGSPAVMLTVLLTVVTSLVFVFFFKALDFRANPKHVNDEIKKPIVHKTPQ